MAIPEDRERVRADLQACIDGKIDQLDAQYRVHHKDGSQRWRLARGVSIRDEAGRVTRVTGTSIDITGLKQVEEELRAANDRLDLAAKLVGFTITEVDLRGPVNPETAMDQGILPADLPRALERFHSLLRAGPAAPDLQPTLEFRARSADGSIRWRAGHGKCFYDQAGAPVRFLSVTYDIEAIKAAEQAAKRVTEQLQLTTRLSGVNVWSYDLDGDADVTRATVRPNNESVLTSLGHRQNPPSTLHARLLAVVHTEDQERVSTAATDCISGKTPMLDTECRFVGNDGSVHWKLVRGVVERDPAGRPLLVAGTVVDIERLKVAEEQARIAIQQLRLATDLSGVGVWGYELGDDGDIATATVGFDGVSEALGYDVDDLPPSLPVRLAAIVHADDQPRMHAALQDCLTGATPMFDTEVRFIAKDGSLRWWLVRGIVSRNTIGVPVTFMGTAVDIEQLKQTQQELHRVKDRLERAVMGSKAATWDLEIPADGDFNMAKAAYTDIWELLGHDVAPDGGANSVETSIVHTMLPDERDQLMAEIRVFLAGSGREWEREVRAVHKSGRPLWLLTRGVLACDAAGRPARFTGTAIDITDRKAVENALQESEERFRRTFENAAVGMILTDIEGRLLEYNARFCEFLGYSREELVDRKFVELMVPEEVAEDLERQKSVVRGDVPSFTRDKQYIRKDGAIVWGNITVSVIQRHADGTPAHVMGILQDITERKALEVEIERAHSRIELALRGSDIAVFHGDFVDPDPANAEWTYFNMWEPLGFSNDPGEFEQCKGPALHP
ncbi:MAG TPA: PAS domain-containing protein, partial [Kofleriaceae bacterium]|nr:PAS domain-containing protein [Kofleriaceae bacterium]